MPTTPSPGLLNAANRTRYDEARLPDGKPRAHWRTLLDALENTSDTQWRDRQEFAQQRIRQNGVTYNIYADPKGAARPWALDIVPLLLGETEWSTLADAVAQRAKLLDLVLADIYGKQELLHEKSIPPALVFGHNGFLWPCCGVKPPGGRFLHVYAADLARSDDGRWWVIADRTQAPSGAGYALENRHIVARLHESPFRDLRVQPLAPFFRAMQQTITDDAPVDPGETLLAVLLTPGPLNETYFEHVYLARQLGFPLVEGQDLTVRGDTLYLKTLGGLRRVHAILRRQDDDFCDPVDLRSDSTLGIAGLVDVTRAGRVLIANALGSGVLESPGISGFLPKLCEQLLGEPLKMPAVATWWCGEAAAREFVEENIERLVLKPAYPSQSMEPVFGDRLDAEARAAWITRLRARPNAYVAQELVKLSQAPSLVSDLTTGNAPQLQPRSIGLRVYAVASEKGFIVMPGGLARVAGDTSIDVLSMQRGGGSKDTWVPGAAISVPISATQQPSQSQTQLQTQSQSQTQSRMTANTARENLPSRAAENLFWLGRYTERVDAHARLLRVAINRLVEDGALETDTLPMAMCVQSALVPAAPIDPKTPATDASPPETISPEALILAAIFDESCPGSLLNNIQRAGGAAANVRERLSIDHWQAIERLQEVFRRGRTVRSPSRPRLDFALSLLERVLLAGTTLNGYALDDMPRDAGWRFLVIGKRIERVQSLALAVETWLYGGSNSTASLESLLDIADGADAWRQRHARAPDAVPALDAILLDESHPHALGFQWRKLRRDLDKLAQQFGSAASAPENPDKDLLSGAMTLPALSLSTPGSLTRMPARFELARELAALRSATYRVSDHLSHRFFTHVTETPSRSIAV